MMEILLSLLLRDEFLMFSLASIWINEKLPKLISSSGVGIKILDKNWANNTQNWIVSNDHVKIATLSIISLSLVQIL